MQTLAFICILILPLQVFGFWEQLLPQKPDIYNLEVDGTIFNSARPPIRRNEPVETIIEDEPDIITKHEVDPIDAAQWRHIRPPKVLAAASTPFIPSGLPHCSHHGVCHVVDRRFPNRCICKCHPGYILRGHHECIEGNACVPGDWQCLEATLLQPTYAVPYGRDVVLPVVPQPGLPIGLPGNGDGPTDNIPEQHGNMFRAPLADISSVGTTKTATYVADITHQTAFFSHTCATKAECEIICSRNQDCQYATFSLCTQQCLLFNVHTDRLIIADLRPEPKALLIVRRSYSVDFGSTLIGDVLSTARIYRPNGGGVGVGITDIVGNAPSSTITTSGFVSPSMHNGNGLLVLSGPAPSRHGILKQCEAACNEQNEKCSGVVVDFVLDVCIFYTGPVTVSKPSLLYKDMVAAIRHEVREETKVDAITGAQIPDVGPAANENGWLFKESR